MNTTDTWMMGGGLPRAVRMIGEGQFLNWEELVAGMTNSAAPASTALAYGAVSWAYRCANMRALTIGGLPWHVIRGKNEVEYPLAVALGRVLDDIEMALCLWGASYILKQVNRVKATGLQWLNPTTMKPVINSSGIVSFEQKLEGQVAPTAFPPEQIIYHRLFNPSDDLGPGIAPMQVALSAAGLAKNANTFAEKFFEHGAVPLVLFTTDQILPKGEADRIKSWWDRTFGGVVNSWKSGILGHGLKPMTIGAPVKDLALTELLMQARQQIAVAFGIPQTMLEDAANFATAREHKLSFYYETIFPEAKLIAAGLNEQLFEAQGLEFEFQFDQVEAVQQDEATKSAAVMAQYSAGLLEDWEARQMLGYSVLPDPPPEVLAAQAKEQAEKDAAKAEAEAKAKAEAEAEALTEPSQEETVTEGSQPQTPAPPARGLSQTAIDDLAKWRRKAQKGRYGFESEAIPSWLMTALNVRLMRDDLRDHAFEPALRKFSREGAEQRLTRKLAINYKQVYDDIVHSLDVGKVPTAVIEGLGKNIGATLAVELAIVIADALLSQSVELDLPLEDYEGTVNDAAKWAEKYAFDEVAGIEQTQVETLEGVIGKLANGEIDHDAAVESLTSVFGPVRAEMIATTEVTRANAESTHIYKTELADHGIKTVERWLTAEDELVCEAICAPLDHTTEDVWSKTQPSGPPAHVRCRCVLVLERVD